jgi:hypothetical protein
MKLSDHNPALIWPSIGRALAAAHHLKCDPASWAEAHNAPSATVRILKSGVPASTLAGDALGDVRNATVAFLESLQTKSVLARMFADRTILRVPLNRRVGLTTSDASAWIVGSGEPVPMSKLELTSSAIAPVKAAALTTVTSEFFEDGGQVLESAFNTSLRNAVAKAIDSYFLGWLTDQTDTASLSSSGPDADDALYDLRAMLEALQPTSGSLYFVGGRSVAIRASCIGSSSGRLFDAMSPTGGELLGLPMLVSDQVGDDLMLIDAAAIAGDLGQVDMRASANASVMQDTVPTNNAATGVGSTLVSMFSTNSIALLCTVSFGVEKLRPAAVLLEDVAWGGEVST